MVLSGLAWYLAEFTSWRSELLGPAGENPPVLTKLDLWLAEPEGKNRIKPEVVILSSSLLMTAALFADHRLYGKAVLPDHESLEQAYPTYDKFLCLQNALQKSRPFCRIINLAGPGAMISEQLLLLKTILKNGMKPYLLILAVVS